MYDYQQFLSIVSGWMSDERFSSLTRITHYRHWLDLQNLRKANFSDFLGWILNPREGHGLDDYFLKALLRAALVQISTREDANDWGAVHGWPTLPMIDGMSLRAAYLTRELKIEPVNLINLIVVDPQNQILILLERQDSVQPFAAELKQYGKWAKRHFPSYRQFWLLLNDCVRVRRHVNSDWLQMDDGWLVAAINAVVDCDRLPETINHQLKDFNRLLSDTSLWESDTYYADIDAALATFAKDKSDDLKRLGTLRAWLTEDAPRLIELDQRYAIQHALPELATELAGSKKNVDEWRQSIDLAVRYHDLFDALLAQNTLDRLVSSIETTSAYMGRFVMTTEHDRRQNGHLYITLRRFDYHKQWPLYLEIVAPKNTVDNDPWSPMWRTRLVLKVKPATGYTEFDAAWNSIIATYRRYNHSEDTQWLLTGWHQSAEMDVESLTLELGDLLRIESRLQQAIIPSFRTTNKKRK